LEILDLVEVGYGVESGAENQLSTGAKNWPGIGVQL
jgi:hypothetical protein